MNQRMAREILAWYFSDRSHLLSVDYWHHVHYTTDTKPSDQREYKVSIFPAGRNEGCKIYKAYGLCTLICQVLHAEGKEESAKLVARDGGRAVYEWATADRKELHTVAP